MNESDAVEFSADINALIEFAAAKFGFKVAPPPSSLSSRSPSHSTKVFVQIDNLLGAFATKPTTTSSYLAQLPSAAPRATRPDGRPQPWPCLSAAPALAYFSTLCETLSTWAAISGLIFELPDAYLCACAPCSRRGGLFLAANALAAIFHKTRPMAAVLLSASLPLLDPSLPFAAMADVGGLMARVRASAGFDPPQEQILNAAQACGKAFWVEADLCPPPPDHAAVEKLVATARAAHAVGICAPVAFDCSSPLSEERSKEYLFGNLS